MDKRMIVGGAIVAIVVLIAAIFIVMPAGSSDKVNSYELREELRVGDCYEISQKQTLAGEDNSFNMKLEITGIENGRYNCLQYMNGTLYTSVSLTYEEFLSFHMSTEVAGEPVKTVIGISSLGKVKCDKYTAVREGVTLEMWFLEGTKLLVRYDSTFEGSNSSMELVYASFINMVDDSSDGPDGDRFDIRTELKVGDYYIVAPYSSLISSECYRYEIIDVYEHADPYTGQKVYKYTTTYYGRTTTDEGTYDSFISGLVPNMAGYTLSNKTTDVFDAKFGQVLCDKCIYTSDSVNGTIWFLKDNDVMVCGSFINTREGKEFHNYMELIDSSFITKI